MAVTSIGDLAHSLVLRTRGAALKRRQDILTAELASGQVSDPAARLGGDLARLTDIDRTLRRLDGFAVTTGEAALFAAAAQAGLERMQDSSTDLATALIQIGPTGLAASRNQAIGQARDELATVIGALNTRAAGRSLFAGTATDTTPLASSDAILSGLRDAVAGAASVTDIVQAATDWFDDPSGFRATIYSGSDDPLAPMPIGNGEAISLSLRADDPAFRAVLRDTALAALAAEPALGLDEDGQSALLRGAGERLLGQQETLTDLRADLGHAEARIEEAIARNSAARTGLEYARGELLSADPYETATRLQEVQMQLESLYSVTVRSANLSLVKFLK